MQPNARMLALLLVLTATARAQVLTDAAWTVSAHEQSPPTGFWSAELVFQTQTPNGSGFDLTGYWDWVDLPLPPAAFGRLHFVGSLDAQGALSLTDVGLTAHPVHGGPVGVGPSTYSAMVDASGCLIAGGQWPGSGPVGGTFIAIKNLPGSAYCFGLSCPCANSATAGCANSTAAGALLWGSGSPSVLQDDLVLTVNTVPSAKNGILFMGGGQVAPAPFGDGLLCVSPGPASFCRFPPQSSGASGTLTLGPGIAAYSQTLPPSCHVGPGDTWNFQAWYRDPAGPCGQSFNLSNGLSVTFTP